MQQKIFNIKVLQNELKKTPLQIPEVHSEIVQSWAESIKNKAIYKQKETALHGHFIQRVLLNILGYDGFTDGKSAWNLQREQQIGSGSVDVALGTFTNEGAKEIIAPFELKGAKTKDLDAIMAGRYKSPVQQAWEYATDNKGTKWVLVSNYTQIRLYNYSLGKHAYESFDLSKLDVPEEYQRLKLLIGAQNLLTGKTLELLEKSEQADKEITNALYKDYKTLREKLITTLGKENPNIDQIELINISQLILDRILFIAFAEDKQLLPDKIIAKAYETQNTFNPQPIWQNFLGLFTAIDKGNEELNIPQYNGGLFKHDPRLENIIFPDELCNNFKELAEYDFDSEVSVNILGHIFEQSISDIEEIKARAAGESFDKKQSKRKKDGVFYTPQYITRYIVEQAVGGWLEDRKQELGFYKLPDLEDSDYEKIKPKNKPTGKIAKHFKYWQAYKDKLASITIIDPACGSGAFLNEVFDYLLLEGEEVNREIARLRGGQGELFRWDTHILANNIFGVDINAESVEITKLGLWLKTANKQEPLTYLEDNIKVGNSLIDDPEVAGDLAFNWQEEFKAIMENGGFDVVVGNPPYVRQELLSELKPALQKNFEVYQGTADLFVYFVELGMKLLKEKGMFGYIVANKWMRANYGKSLRKYISTKTKLLQIIDFGELPIFENAATFPMILVTQKQETTRQFFLYAPIKDLKLQTLQKEIQKVGSELDNEALGDGNWTLTSKQEVNLLKKMQQLGQPLEKYISGKIYWGIKTGYNKAFVIDEFTKDRLIAEDPKSTEIIKPFLEGKDVRRYAPASNEKFVIFTRRGIDIDLYPAIKNHLGHYKEELTPKPKHWKGKWIGRKAGSYKWFEIQDNVAYFLDLEKPKIIYPEIAQSSRFTFDIECLYTNNKCFFIAEENFFLLGILNSKLAWLFLKRICSVLGDPDKGGRLELRSIHVSQLPIHSIDFSKPNDKAAHDFIVEKVASMLEKNKQINELLFKFLNLLKSRLSLEKPSQKLEKWYELSFKEFKGELKKKKITLSLSDEVEWLEYFTQQQTQARAINEVIAKTDAEIDQMVYKLYELTPEEIKIVES